MNTKEALQYAQGVFLEDYIAEFNETTKKLSINMKPVIKIILSELRESVGKMKKEEIITLDCDNCGEAGWGKVWYGKGEPNDPHGFGDAYYPTGDAVFCEECFKSHGIGKEWNGERIWKCTSDNPQDEQIRLNYIKVKSSQNVAQNKTLADVESLIATKLTEYE